MSNSQTTLVNQRLYFCQLQLNTLRQAIACEQYPRHVAEQVGSEALYFHLSLCYQQYLRELAENYGFNDCSCISAQALQATLDAVDKRAAEVEELVKLEGSGYWLGQMLQAFSQLSSLSLPPLAQVNGSPPTGEQLILVTQMPIEAIVSSELAESYLQKLRELIDGQRQIAGEW